MKLIMKIENFDQLAVTDERKALLAIAEAGLEAIDTKAVVRKLVAIDGNFLKIGNERIDLDPASKLVFIAVGKCAADAAEAFSAIAGDQVARGVAVDVKDCLPLKNIRTFKGTHPLPSDDNLKAAEAIMESLQGLTDRDAVVFVISGGGSTLLFLPQDRNDRREAGIFNELTRGGATIQEMNIVRKHLSLARGGHLAEAAYPARVVSLIFSDVPGDDIASISSGPTVKDDTTVEDAGKILKKYGAPDLPLIETPKDSQYFERVTNVLAVSNGVALAAMKKAAEERGFNAAIRDMKLAGEAAAVARKIADEIRAAPEKSALLWGGETTVTIRGNGEGGRNMTVSAAALEFIKEGEAILSFASDGRDHSPYAGAICDTITKVAIEKAGVDVKKFLAENNTYPLFEKIGNYLLTGDTGSNVSDLIIALKQ